MSSSDLSELSSSPLTDDDEVPQSIPKGKLEHYFKVGASALPPKLKKKRPPSPPHEYVLADNPDIAVSIRGPGRSQSEFIRVPAALKGQANVVDAQFICMFRSRFADAFSKSLPHYGPQDIERGVVDSPPGDHIERLLCALLGLLLNRKKEVEYVVNAPLHSLHLNSTKITKTHGSHVVSTSGRVTTREPWRKLFKHIRRNGRKRGRVKTHFMEAAALTI